MPSNKILQQKQAVVSDLSDKLSRASSAVLVQYQGITVEDDTKLRAALRGANVEYAVIKNTLIKRAAEDAGFNALADHLGGMTALAIAFDDPVAPAKVLKEYADKIESFELRAGIVDGGVIDKSGVEALAAIPGREALIGKFLGSISGPMSKLAIVLQALVDKKTADEAAPAVEAAPAAEAAPAEA